MLASAGVLTLALFTKSLCIISAAVVCQIFAVVCSNRAKQLRCKAICNSDRKLVPRNQKRHNGTHHDDDGCMFFTMCFPRCPPVNLNMNLLTVYNHMDAVTKCCDWDPDPPNILKSDKVKFFTLNYIITWSPSVNRTLSNSYSQGGRLFSDRVITTKHFFLPETDVFFWPEICGRLGRPDKMTDRRTDRMTDTSITSVFFFFI